LLIAIPPNEPGGRRAALAQQAPRLHVSLTSSKFDTNGPSGLLGVIGTTATDFQRIVAKIVAEGA
jgi:transcriptional regulator of heat shock response